MAACVLLGALPIVCCSTVLAGERQSLSLAQLLGRLSEKETLRSASLSQYRCLRHYSLYNERFHKTAEMTVRMTYVFPGHKSFEVLSEGGPSVIRRRVLRRMLEAEEESSRDEIRHKTQITPENYEFKLLGTGIQHGRPAFMLSVAPRSPNKFLIRGTVWVDREDFSIVRIEGTPAVNPSPLLRNTAILYKFAKIGQFWLPETHQSETDSFLFGRTTLTIYYSKYEVTQTPGR